MTRVLFIGAPVEAVDQPGLDARRKLELTGWNTGNLLIGGSLRRQIAYSSYEHSPERDPASVDDEFDLIAIPASNFVFPGFDFGWLADFLEQTTLPCLVVGLGAQAPSFEERDLGIPEGTLRFLRIVSERTARIGVRGEFSADVIARLGIQNLEITGCPSLFVSLQPQLALDTPPFGEETAISFNGSRDVVDHAFSKQAATALEARLVELALEGGHDFVLQSELPELELLGDGEVAEHLLEQVWSVKTRLGLPLETEEYVDFVRRHCRAFFSIDSWVRYVRTRDLFVGTRFHGNLVAAVHGVPALMFVHDTRTTEMCDWIRLPYRTLEDGPPDDLRALYEAVDFDPFVHRYAGLYARYREFLEANGVAHNLS